MKNNKWIFKFIDQTMCDKAFYDPTWLADMVIEADTLEKALEMIGIATYDKERFFIYVEKGAENEKINTLDDRMIGCETLDIPKSYKKDRK